MHNRAHNEGLREHRGNLLLVRGLPVFSYSLGISGQCDVVEFHKTAEGVPLSGEDGLWLPYPVEYKHGKPKQNDADKMQLCAQAMCLEEMLCCDIAEGALFYGETKHRLTASFTPELRAAVKDALTEMHGLYNRGYTPKVKPNKACNSCSLKDLCLPRLQRSGKVANYLKQALKDTI